jgi:signal peptidase II
MIYIIGCISIILGVFLDQYTKYLAVTHLQEQSITIVKDVFQLHYLENHGAAFGILQNQQWFFLIATIVTLAFIVYLYIRLPHQKHFLPLRICLISIVAGAIGNMIDRIRLQYVIDFIYFKIIDFPIFNVADIFATVSTFALIILFLFYYSEEDFDLIFNLCLSKRKNKQESC